MPSFTAFISGRRAALRSAGFISGCLGLALAVPLGNAAPAFFGVTTMGEDVRPQPVMAGRTTEFVLTLSSSAVENPQLRATLSATAGGIAAPLFKGSPLELSRTDPPRTGVQRYKFQLAIPAVQHPQAMVLQLEARTVATDWVPLPAVLLQASPRTWPDTLRRFVQALPSGRVAGSVKLEQLFQLAKLTPPQISLEEPGSDPAVRVWFAETEAADFQPAETAPAIWVVFKPGVHGGVELWRPAADSAPCVAVDAGILSALDLDPSAQEIFERALALAHALAPHPPVPSTP